MIHTQLLRRISSAQLYLLNNIRPSSSANIDLEKLEAESTTAIEG